MVRKEALGLSRKITGSRLECLAGCVTLPGPLTFVAGMTSEGPPSSKSVVLGYLDQEEVREAGFLALLCSQGLLFPGP